MKNLKLFISLFIVIVFSVDLFPGVGGEIILHPISLNGNTTFNLHVYKSNDYAWLWDKDNSKVVYVGEYNQTWENLTINTYGFDEPRDAPGADRGTIPWGVINFVITSGYQTISFALDLRDYNWSQNQSKYWTHDTYINFDFSINNGIVFLSQGAARNVYDPNDPEQIATTNSTQQIWSFWSPGSTPFQDYFTVPVTLVNEVENTSYHYGALYANGQQIPTGGQDYFKLRSAQVSTYTDLINYNGNNYSFKWEHTNVTPLANIKIYNSYTLFNSTLDVINKEVKRIFRPVYPLTIKNSLDELGGISVDNVYFKDPTTINSYELKSASGSGFFKDNAFNELDIEVNGQLHQKYGAKSKSIIDYNGYKFQYSYGDFNTTGTDFLITEPTTKVAHYKGVQLSNTSTTYNNTSQNKFLKTSDGYLHNVYESMGDVYYEKSSDGGTTWVIMNDGKPINPFPEYGDAKSPSIACSNDGNDLIYITYQSTLSNSGISSPVVMLTQYANGNLHWHQEVYDLSGYSFSDDYQQVVAAMNNVVMVVFNAPTPLGFIAKEYLLSSSGSITTEYARTLPNVDVNSTLPSLVAGGGKYHLAYQQAAFSIRYLRWSVNSNPLTSSYSSIPSTGSGYSLNTNPTISLANLNPLISWKGGQYTGLREAVLRRGTLSGSNMIWGDYLKVGSNVNYIHNNSASSTTEKTVMSWSQDVSTTKWVKRTYPINGSTHYSSPANLSHTGINIQVSNGSDYNNMKANIFRSSAPLYYFTQSTTDFSAAQEEGGGGLNKITVDDTLVTFGRSGVADINGVEFIFEIGDILVGDSIVQFIDKPDTIVYTSSNELNEYTRTKSFVLTPSTSFYFTNIYYTVLKSSPDTALSNADAVNFKAELVNANTNQVIGAFDNITYSKNNLQKYASIDYEVDCSGIISGEYYLRLVTSVNTEAEYALANIISDNTTLAKKNFNKVNFTGSEIPITYELSNNYPNPFNPSTTIRYQIPHDGIVTLKIYDILGSEVATLVNEEKLAGKYEVNFNAINLASGVYIYKIQAGTFVNSKKMILLK